MSDDNQPNFRRRPPPDRSGKLGVGDILFMLTSFAIFVIAISVLYQWFGHS